MRSILALICVLVVVGCQSGTSEPTAAAPEDEGATKGPATTTAQANGGGDSNSGGIAPMTPSPIPNAPVSGSESLQGGGSAVGTVAKDRAKEAAAQASGTSLGQAGSAGDGD